MTSILSTLTFADYDTNEEFPMEHYKGKEGLLFFSKAVYADEVYYVEVCSIELLPEEEREYPSLDAVRKLTNSDILICGTSLEDFEYNLEEAIEQDKELFGEDDEDF